MYGKLFSSAYTGSMMGKGSDVFAVWGYVIANAVNSQIELNPVLLSALIGEPVEAMEAAIEFLCQPDARSRSKLEEGRRLVREGEYAYFVPNHETYSKIKDERDRRDYMRAYMREKRAREAAAAKPPETPPVAPIPPPETEPVNTALAPEVNSQLTSLPELTVNPVNASKSQLALLGHTDTDTDKEKDQLPVEKDFSTLSEKDPLSTKEDSCQSPDQTEQPPKEQSTMVPPATMAPDRLRAAAGKLRDVGRDDPPESDLEFMAFWIGYPVEWRGSRSAAWSAWKQNVRKKGIDPAAVVAGRQRYVTWAKARGFKLKNASTFLGKDQLWSDEYELGEDTDSSDDRTSWQPRRASAAEHGVN